MAHFTIREVTLSWVSGRRRHHSGGLTDIYTPQQSNVSNGDHIILPPPAATADWDDSNNQHHHANFAFMSIGGGTNGAVMYTADDLAHGHPVPGVNVGDGDVNAVILYLEPGTGPGGGVALCIDAFNVTTGQFIDDDFVSVTVNGVLNAGLSSSINYDGVVATDGVVNEHIIAFNAIANQGFEKWQSLSGTEVISGNDLTVGTGSTAYYLALYEKTDPPHLGRIDDYYSIWQWVDKGTMVDGGPHPWSPDLVRLAAGIAMAVKAKYSSPKLQAQALELAAKQVELAAKGIATSILESAKKAER